MLGIVGGAVVVVYPVGLCKLNRMTEEDLCSIAHMVRARLESANLSKAHECFHSFPRGACGVTCDVLATVLEHRFATRPLWVGARFADDTDASHAWLEVGGFIVDITADQFGKEPVIVAKRSDWHATLNIDYRHYFPATERNWGEVGRTVWHLVGDLAVPVVDPPVI